MALVEAVAGKFVHLVEDLGRRRPVDVVGDRSGDEGLALGLHLLLDLLAHRPAQDICLSQAESGELLGDLHDLFLVDHDAEGFLQDPLERGVQIVRLLLPVLAGDIARNVVHRPRTIEGDDGDDVLETIGLQLAQRIAHARAFQLEHAGRIPMAQHGVGLGIVERQARQIEFDATTAHQLLGLGEDGQRLEAEEIELHQPDLLHILHAELRHRHVGARIAVERNEFLERPVGDDDAGGMGGCVAIESFEFARDVEQPPDVGIFGDGRAQLPFAFDRLGKAHRIGWIVGHELA